MRRSVPFVAATFLAVIMPERAHGGPNEQRLAQALFDEARRLMDQKRFSEACPKLAESQRLDPGGGTLLNLAVCHASDGKTATALVEYNEALSVATRDGRRDREELARTAIAKLEAEVPRVTVIVPPSHRVAGLEVKIDESALPSVAWDVPMSIDPGSHAVVASIPGRAPWTAVISVLPSEKKTIEIPLLTTRAEQPPAVVPPPSVIVPPSPQETPPPAEKFPTTAQRTSNPVYIGLLATTITAGATSVITGILALSEQSKAEDNCIADRNWCRSQGGRDAAENAQTLAVVSTVALLVGAVGVVGLFIVPSKRSVVKAGRMISFEATF